VGLKPDALDFIFKCIDSHFASYANVRMLELGNQQIKKGGERQAAKTFFEGKGFIHTSFDLNGKDGALPIDLSHPVPEKYHDMFDVVTNSGTTEHVEPLDGQFECFRNIHSCTKPGGVMIHIVPEDGSFPNHCPFYYTNAFFRKLAELNNYEVIEETKLYRGKYAMLAVGLTKKDFSVFCDKEDGLPQFIIQRPCTRKRIKPIRQNIKTFIQYKPLQKIRNLIVKSNKFN
jgi:hypothetical protein